MMPARLAARTFVLAAAIAALSLTAAADESFVRLQEDGSNAALQTAYATYESPDSKVKITLYGVVHIADQAYYERVQKDLDGHDTVLFEAVTPEDPSKVPEEAASIGKLQKTMGELLGLTFQKDGIDYTRKNLVHADMTWEQFQAALGGNAGGLSPLGNFIDADTLEQLAPFLEMAAKIGKFFLDGNPEMRDGMKLQMARQLSGQMDQMEEMMGADMMRVILVERNKVALEVLAKQLEKQEDGSIAVFYGAAHMPDMQERLEKLGWKQVDKKWVSAWQIGRGIASDPSGGPARPERVTPKKDESKVWY